MCSSVNVVPCAQAGLARDFEALEVDSMEGDASCGAWAAEPRPPKQKTQSDFLNSNDMAGTNS